MLEAWGGIKLCMHNLTLLLVVQPKLRLTKKDGLAHATATATKQLVKTSTSILATTLIHPGARVFASYEIRYVSFLSIDGFGLISIVSHCGVWEMCHFIPPWRFLSFRRQREIL